MSGGLLFLSSYNFSNIFADSVIGDVLALEEVFGNKLANLFLSFRCESVLLDLELHNALILQQTAFQSSCVALIDLIGRDV